MQYSVKYILFFAAAVCGVCSVFVAGSAVLLKERQLFNKQLDRQKKVLLVAGLMQEGDKLAPEQITTMYGEAVTPVVIDLKSGKPAPEVDAASFDQLKAAADPATSELAPDNAAKVRRLPTNAVVYQVKQEGKLTALILPVEGQGLWSTLYGFLALKPYDNTIHGITFYQHGETPGLGGEVDNPRWKGLWPGRKAFDGSGKPKITVKKGAAGPVDSDPYQVDGLSGATITSRGVTHLVQFWLDEHGFGPYLASYRAENGI